MPIESVLRLPLCEKSNRHNFPPPVLTYRYKPLPSFSLYGFFGGLGVFDLSIVQLHFYFETFAKFLSLPTAETQTQVFGCFRPKYLLILPKYPLNPPRIPDNQASGLLFRRQRAHLTCWPLSTGSNTSLSGGFA
ncbi:TPA: hypothetical protein ACXH5C_002075, partial [Neisseria meningitidis]